MASLQDTNSVSLGKGYQTQSGLYSTLYGRVSSTYTEYETYYSISVTGYFKYDGWWNCAPWEIGVYKVPTNATSASSFQSYGTTQGKVDPTLEANANSWISFGTYSFTCNKDASNSYGAIPYLKIGCVKYPSGDPWQGINSYGLLRWDTATANSYAGKVGMSYGGVSLDCWCILGGKSNSTSFTYANAPLIVGAITPKAYGEATSFTIYSAANTPKTVYF